VEKHHSNNNFLLISIKRYNTYRVTVFARYNIIVQLVTIT